MRVSLPVPPDRLSAPAPPSSTSLPAPPVKVSLKALPMRFSMVARVSVPAPTVFCAVVNAKLTLTPAVAVA